MTLKENSQLIFYFSPLFSVSFRTLWAYGFGESHPEGLGLDGLTEQSAKL